MDELSELEKCIKSECGGLKPKRIDIIRAKRLMSYIKYLREYKGLTVEIMDDGMVVDGKKMLRVFYHKKGNFYYVKGKRTKDFEF